MFRFDDILGHGGGNRVGIVNGAYYEKLPEARPGTVKHDTVISVKARDGYVQRYIWRGSGWLRYGGEVPSSLAGAGTSGEQDFYESRKSPYERVRSRSTMDDHPDDAGRAATERADKIRKKTSTGKTSEEAQDPKSKGSKKKPSGTVKKPVGDSGSKNLRQDSTLNQLNKPTEVRSPRARAELTARQLDKLRELDRKRYHKKRAPKLIKPGTLYDPNKHRLMKSKQYLDENNRVKNIRRYRVGEQYRASKGKPLTGGLYVKQDGTIGRTSVARAERSRALMEHKREQRKLSKAKKREIRLEVQRARDRIGKNVTRKKQRAVVKKIRDKDFMTRLRKAEGFRKQPVLFAMRKQLDGARLRPGQKQLVDSLPHSVRHPPVRHASRRPMTPPVPMDGLNGRMRLVSRHWTGRGERISGVPGQFAVTPDTLRTSKFPEGGYGIYFRLNTTNIVNALSRHYPQQMIAASKRFAPMIGKKLLDIIEPYVPKDTGLMYTTATEVSGRDISDSFRGVGSIGDSSFGVAISYNTPYAEMVYYDETKAHGREYNLKHGTNVKGELETARWIEAAFNSPAERVRIRGLMEEYASKVVGALKSVRLKPSK